MSELLFEPWKGRSGILLSIDIGIAYSGVSFVYLENGAKPTLQQITKWPGQEGEGMESMVPTMVWYDANNEASDPSIQFATLQKVRFELKAVTFGAEALSYRIEEQARSEGWFLAKGFKAHLYPEGNGSQQNPRISALPFGVSLRQVYSDFLKYLLKHTKLYFEERIIDGARIWETYQPTMEVVISHPKGWGTREQSFLRDAAVRAGYTTYDLAPRSIRFVSDLEASAHCCLSQTSLTTKLQTGDTLILCDVGTTATNISVHKVESTDPIVELETCDMECLEGGATSIDTVVERCIRQKMADAGVSPEDVNDFTRAGIEDFRKHVKFAFNDETREYLIQIANARFNNPALNTRRGRMVLAGSVVKSFFVDYMDTLRQAIDRRITEARANISRILLVGRFGDSSYLQRVFKETYEPRGYQIALAANSTSRAVVDGALIWDVRINNGYRPRQSIGIETSCGSWLELVTKGDVIRPGTEITKPVSLTYPTPHPKFDKFELKFLSSTNEAGITRTRNERGALLDGFTKWFTLSADLSSLSGALVERLGKDNIVHWRLNFDICVRFEEAGLEAYLEWEEKGETRNGSVTIRPSYEF